jgi:predicted membrane chloride channel (bestrophin family)
MKIYDEYVSKIKSASCTDTLRHFAERLCVKMGVRSLGNSQKIQEILEANNVEVLEALRDDTQYAVLLMREIVEQKKEERKEIEAMTAMSLSKGVDPVEEQIHD